MSLMSHQTRSFVIIVKHICYCVLAITPAALPAGKITVTPSGSGDSLNVSVQTESDTWYGLEHSDDLENWSTVQTFSGDGTTQSASVPYDGRPAFFRFVSEENGVLHGPVNYTLSDAPSFSASGGETARILSSNGLSTSDDLFNRFRSVYRLNDELERLNAAGVTIDAGAVVNLLREVELRGNLAGLVEAKALGQASVDSLVAAGISVEDLYERLRNLPPAPANRATAMAGGGADEETLDRHNTEAYLELNNDIAVVGGTKFTRAGFVALRNHLSALTPQSEAAITESNQDKTAGRSGTRDLPAQNELRLLGENPSNFSYLADAARKFGEARLRQEPLPLPITGFRKVAAPSGGTMAVEIEAAAPFTNDDGNYRAFLVNRECLATLFIYGNASGGRLLIESPDGAAIVDETIPAQASRAVCLAVPQDLVGRKFRVLNEGHLSVSLVAMQECVNLDSGRDGTGLNIRTDIPVTRRGPAAGCGWYRFTVEAQSAGPQTQALVLRSGADGATTAPHEAVLLAPDGHLYRQNLMPDTDTEISVTLAPGAWQLFVLPLESAVLKPDGGALAGTKPVEAAWSVDVSPTLDLRVAFVPVKTRNFVLGTLDTVSFIRDGEKQRNRAEIKLTLTANIAPYFEQSESFSAAFGNTWAYKAWKLWVDNDKSLDGIRDQALFITGIDAMKAEESVNAAYASLHMFRPDDADTVATDYLYAFTLVMQDELSSDWYAHIDGAASMYANWADHVVQINAMKYPWGNRYNIRDSIAAGDDIDPFTKQRLAKGYAVHPVLPTSFPLFGIPKDRMAAEAQTINCSYNAKDYDELDKWDLAGSFVKGVVNVGLSLYQGNFAQAACNGVSMVDEMNSTIEDAKDDPIGTANFRLNRASTLSGFYGLADDTMNPVVFSGYARKNADNLFTNALNWAKLGCDTVNFANSLQGGPSFDFADPLAPVKARYYAMYDILSGNVTDFEDLRSSFLTLAGQSKNVAEAERIVNEFFDNLEAGTVNPAFMDDFNFADLSAALSNGDDNWSDFASMYAQAKNMRGVGALGHNLVHSNADYLFNGYETRKTQGRASVGIVRSVPLKSAEVQLVGVKVFDVQEELGQYNPAAEVYINTRVGVISDQLPVAWNGAELYNADEGVLVAENGSQGYRTVGQTPFTAYARRKFPVRTFEWDDGSGFLPADGTWYPRGTDDPEPTLINATWNDGNNAAAIYVEIGVFEDDGGTCDDDMIGVYSHTFRLEDLMKSGEATWVQTGGKTWRLYVTDAALFSARWLESEVEIGTGAVGTDMQRAHNAERLNHPSALVSFTVDLTLGDFLAWNDASDYDIPTSEVEGTPLDTLNIQIVANGSAENLDQLLDLKGGRALAHVVCANEGDHSLEVWTVDTAAPALTRYITLPAAGMSAEALLPFGADEYLNAVLSPDGNRVLVLCRDGLATYDIADPANVTFHSYSLSGLYPNRIAVDSASGEVWVSLRKTGRDLLLFGVDSGGSLTLRGNYDEIPRSVAGLYPLKSGGMIVHYVGNMKEDTCDFGPLGYWDDADDIMGSVGGDDRFGNSNGFLLLKYEGGAFVTKTYINIARDVAESQMSPVDNGGQSSMFLAYDDFTLISRYGSALHRPFALHLDSTGFFTEMESVNTREKSGSNTCFEARNVGMRMGGVILSPTVPGYQNRDARTAYSLSYWSASPTILSPFCAYTKTSVSHLKAAKGTLVSEVLLPVGDAANRFLVTLANQTRYTAGAPRACEYLKNSGGTAQTGKLALVDLFSTLPDPTPGHEDPDPVTDDPDATGTLLIPTSSSTYEELIDLCWRTNGSIVLGWGSTSGGPFSLVNASDRTNMTRGLRFGDRLVNESELVGGFDDGSFFARVWSTDYSKYWLVRFTVDESGAATLHDFFNLTDGDYLTRIRRVPGRDVIVVVNQKAHLQNGYVHVYKKVGNEWKADASFLQLPIVPSGDVAISPDGNTLAIGGYRSTNTENALVYLYNLNTLDNFLTGADTSVSPLSGVWTLPEEASGKGFVDSLAFTADSGRLLVGLADVYNGSYGNMTCISDVSSLPTVTKAGTWNGSNYGNLTLTPDGTGLIACDTHGLYVLDATHLTQAVVKSSYAAGGVVDFSIYPDGTKIAILTVDYNSYPYTYTLSIIPMQVLLDGTHPVTYTPDPE